MQVTANRTDPEGLSITSVSFIDRELDTLQLRDGEWAESDARGVWVHRPRFNQSDLISFYPWSSVFSLGYAA